MSLRGSQLFVDEKERYKPVAWTIFDVEWRACKFPVVTELRCKRWVALVATGGLARRISQETDLISHVDEDLTLRGLKRLDELNR